MSENEAMPESAEASPKTVSEPAQAPKKRGRGRPPLEKVKIHVSITHAQFDECLRYGDTIQKGIETIINRSIESQDGPEADPPMPPPSPDSVSLRWICKSSRCYVQPANYGDKCSSCGAPRPVPSSTLP